MSRVALSFGALAALLLTGCGSDTPPKPKAPETEIPKELQSDANAARAAAEGELGTPMAERVATLGLLNKRNNLTQDLQMKPGESKRVGDVIVRLSACERTAPWEMPQEIGAFAQVLVRDKASDEWNRVFSGWLFRNSPSLNVVEHPIYDVWVKDCAMSFPGEEDTPRPAASATPSAGPSAALGASPTPSPSASATTAE